MFKRFKRFDPKKEFNISVKIRPHFLDSLYKVSIYIQDFMQNTYALSILWIFGYVSIFAIFLLLDIFSAYLITRFVELAPLIILGCIVILLFIVLLIPKALIYVIEKLYPIHFNNTTSGNFKIYYLIDDTQWESIHFSDSFFNNLEKRLLLLGLITSGEKLNSYYSKNISEFFPEFKKGSFLIFNTDSPKKIAIIFQPEKPPTIFEISHASPPYNTDTVERID